MKGQASRLQLAGSVGGRLANAIAPQANDKPILTAGILKVDTLPRSNICFRGRQGFIGRFHPRQTPTHTLPEPRQGYHQDNQKNNSYKNPFSHTVCQPFWIKHMPTIFQKKENTEVFLQKCLSCRSSIIQLLLID